MNNKSRLRRGVVIALALTVLSIVMAAKNPNRDVLQDQNFRLLNLERRVDLLQQRVDYVERVQQSQAMKETGGAGPAVLELQRQQLSLAEQQVTLQRQMLELQKKIDNLTERKPEPKKK